MGDCPDLKLERQNDGSAQGSVDCGPSCGVMLVDWGTCHKTRPETEDIRKHAGVPSGYTTPADIERAVEWYGVEVNRKSDAPWDRAIEALDNPEACVMFGIDYGTVEEQIPGHHVGTFDGNHFVVATNRKLNDAGKWIVKVFDPLATEAAWWPLWALRDAAEDYADGYHIWSGNIVKRP
jgi:hypothetical protein